MIDRYSFPQKRAWQGLFALYLFLILYLVRVSQVSHYLLGFYKAQALTIGLTAVAVIVFFAVQRKHWRAIVCNPRMVLLAVFCAAALLPMVFKKDYTMMYFSILFSMVLGLFFSYFLSCRRAAKYYVLILLVLAVWSLLCIGLLRPLADRGLLPAPVFSNEYGGKFYNFLLCFSPITFARERNFGIFREPGVYQFFLFLALYLTCYQVEWEKEAHMWVAAAILSITLLTTFATGGIAAAALFLLAVYFDKKVYKTKPGKIFTVAALLLLAVFAAYLLIAKPSLYTYFKLMLLKLQPGNSSSEDRLESIRFNLYCIQWSPFVGRTVSYILETVTHNTSSSTILIGILGVLGGSVNIVAWLFLIFRGKGSIPAKIVSLVTLAVTFNTQNLASDPFLWIFPIMAMTEGILEFLPKIAKKQA